MSAGSAWSEQSSFHALPAETLLYAASPGVLLRSASSLHTAAARKQTIPSGPVGGTCVTPNSTPDKTSSATGVCRPAASPTTTAGTNSAAHHSGVKYSGPVTAQAYAAKGTTCKTATRLRRAGGVAATA